MCQVLKGLFAANLEKALTFLDDRLLGDTSSTVERGKRRYRNIQKTADRVRTMNLMAARLALDIFREMATPARGATLTILPAKQAGSKSSRQLGYSLQYS